MYEKAEDIQANFNYLMKSVYEITYILNTLPFNRTKEDHDGMSIQHKKRSYIIQKVETK